MARQGFVWLRLVHVPTRASGYKEGGNTWRFSVPIAVSHLVMVMTLFTKLACGSGSLQINIIVVAWD